MPRDPRLPIRPRPSIHVYTFRCALPRWLRFRDAVRRDGRTVSQLFNRFIDDYIDEQRGGVR